MPREYFQERLRAQEEQIASLRSDIEAARSLGDNKLMEDLERKLDVAQRLRETYERMLREAEIEHQFVV
jgi:hypothetical protein